MIEYAIKVYESMSGVSMRGQGADIDLGHRACPGATERRG